MNINSTRKSVLVSFLFLCQFVTWAQPAIINGTSKSYAGDEITFYRYSDLITNTEEELGKCRFDANGSFKCELKLSETSFVFSHLGIYKIYLFAEPGKTYNLALPDKEAKTEGQRLNPFFRETDLHVGIKNIDKNDINFLINAFDLSFNEKFDLIINDTYKGKTRQC